MLPNRDNCLPLVARATVGVSFSLLMRSPAHLNQPFSLWHPDCVDYKQVGSQLGASHSCNLPRYCDGLTELVVFPSAQAEATTIGRRRTVRNAKAEASSDQYTNYPYEVAPEAQLLWPSGIGWMKESSDGPE